MQKREGIRTLITLVLDLVLILFSYGGAYFLRDYLNGTYLVPFGRFVWFMLLAALIYVLVFAFLGLYSTEERKNLVEQLLTIVLGGLAATTMVGAVIYFSRTFDYSRLIMALAFGMSVFLVWLGRVLISLVEKILQKRGVGVTRVLLVGSGQLLKMTLNSFKMQEDYAYELVGVVGDDLPDELAKGVRQLGGVDKLDLEKLVKDEGIDEIVLADENLNEQTALEIINLSELHGVNFKYVPNMFDVAMVRIVTRDLAGMPVIELRSTVLEGWMRIVKRVFDVVASGLGLVILLPLFLLTAVVIKLDSEGPVLFRQRRVGRLGEEFELLKFRSMEMIRKGGKMFHASANKEVEKLKEEQPNYKLENDPRITRVGHFIRKTSIDELPQLFNVLKGEMSLVGPRAYVAKELETQQKNFPGTRALVRRLLAVKPGITGVWQVSGRSNVDFAERVSMDAYYATHATIWTDFKLLLRTIPVVLKGSGAM